MSELISTIENRPNAYIPLTITKSDSTVHPSYTNLVLPYRVICRQRYRKARYRYRQQFMSEIQRYEGLQWKALCGVRVHRVYCDALLTAPSEQDFITLTAEEKRRLQYLLEN